MFLASMLLELYLSLYNYCKHLSQKMHFKDNSTPVGLEADGNKELVNNKATQGRETRLILKCILHMHVTIMMKIT